jgi:hypothetical protein
VNFCDFSEKSRNFDDFADLLKKNPAENACAFGETGVYVLLLKFIGFLTNLSIFSNYFRPFTRVLEESRVPSPEPRHFRERSVAYY